MWGWQSDVTAGPLGKALSPQVLQELAGPAVCVWVKAPATNVKCYMFACACGSGEESDGVTHLLTKRDPLPLVSHSTHSAASGAREKPSEICAQRQEEARRWQAVG